MSKIYSGECQMSRMYSGKISKMYKVRHALTVKTFDQHFKSGISMISNKYAKQSLPTRTLQFKTKLFFFISRSQQSLWLGNVEKSIGKGIHR